MGDGTYEVGVDIQPCEYKTKGGESEWYCYFERSSATSGESIDWDTGHGPQVVVVKPGEFFETERCGTWTLAG
jgi:hypothetical protein